jgi:serine/threonine protein kinase
MNKLGKYEILDEIGRGGFATVYKARDPDLDQLVAVKVLHGGYTDRPDVVQLPPRTVPLGDPHQT